MARLFPDEPAAHSESGAELLIFDRIRTELSDEWLGVHSLGLTTHSRKPWAEIDFVLIGPPGVLCLEVKGGLLSRTGGRWFTTPRKGAQAGVPQPLKESPFEQVGPAAAALHNFLQETVPEADGSLTAFAVVAPDGRWTIDGPDIERALVFDGNDLARGFGAFVERVVGHWRRRRGKRRGLDGQTRRKILQAVRGDFSLVPSLSGASDIARKELVRLTDEQAELFSRLANNPRVIAVGGAGTGKTLIAAEEARRLASGGAKVLLTCFSRNLAAHLRSQLASVAGLTVRHLHSLMAGKVREAGREDELPDAEETDLFEEFYPALCFEILSAEPREGLFDTVIVDEGQDLLLESYVEVIGSLLKGGIETGKWRWFLDPHQDLFEAKGSLSLKRLRATGAVDWQLTVNCRNTARVAAAVSLLSQTAPSPTLVNEGPDVRHLWSGSLDQTPSVVAKELKALIHDGIAPHSITVLSPMRFENSLMASLPTTFKIPIARLNAECVEEVEAITFSTIAGFKGLESEVVFLIDVDDLLSDMGRRHLYVGASRANVLLVLVLQEDLRDDFNELARRFGELLSMGGRS